LLIAHADEATTLGRLEQASATYSLLLELQPDHDEGKTRAAAFWSRCADLFDSQGQLDSAVESLTKLVALFPDDAVASARLAAGQRKLDERQTIGRIFEHAFAAHRAGKMDQARDGWKKLIQLDVLSYEGLNIATMLAETVLAPTPETTPKQGIQGGSDRMVDVLEPAGVGETHGTTPVEVKTPPKRRKAGAHHNEPVSVENAEKQEEQNQQAQWAHEPRAADKSGEPTVASTPESVTYDPFPVHSPTRGVLFAVGVIASVIIFLSWPASITSLYLEPHREVKTGDTFGIDPYLTFSSDWRRRTDEHPSRWSCSWSSTNSGVATVDSFGYVRAIAPGRAEIVAEYRGFRASTDVVVVPSVTALTFASQKRLKVGETARLNPTLVDSRGQQREADGSQSDFVWASQNQAIATVNAANVKGIAPGTARITVRYQGVEGATSVVVLPWDVPAMKGNVSEIKFFIDGKTQEMKDRQYKTQFSPEMTIWAELTVDLDQSAQQRDLSAAFSYTVYRSDNSEVERLKNMSFKITAQKDWRGVVKGVLVGQLPPDTYRVDFMHGKVIGSGTFVVK
jgi:hypothetical protein